jgi:ribosomal protein S18 acetylase RimI-like enzyme
MEIREIHDEEFQTVGELAVAAYRAVPGMQRHHDHIEELRDIATRVQHNSIYVAVLDGRIAGCVTYVPDSTSPLAEFSDLEAAAIRALAVDPCFHRRGVGRRLTEHCIAEARRRGKARLVLHTTDELTSAHALYRSMGFQRAPELDFLDGDVTLTAYAYSTRP